MKTVTEEIRNLSIKSLQSTFVKLSNANISMTKKGANNTLVKKRLNAVKVGLESLKGIWNGEDFYYDAEIILTSKNVLQHIIPSIEQQIVKSKESSSQRTLNERRLTALKLAIDSLDDRLR